MQRLLLAALVTVAVIAVTRAETTCQNHARNSRNSAHGLSWNITCDANGHYLPLQCTNDANEKKRWCACYNKEEQVSQPSMKLRHCECHLAKSRAVESNAAPCDVPECARDGKYITKRCCAETGKCYCVNPNTGEVTVQPTNNQNINCPTQ